MVVHVRQEGSPTTVAENLLSRARQALEEGRAIEALTLAAQSEGEIERVELQTTIARAALETVEAKLGEAEHDGVRAPMAIEHVRKAKHAFEQKQFPSVFELALEATDQLAASREQQRRARDALDGADRQVKEALELGADVDEVLQSLEKARHHSQAGEYPSATHTAREAADMARWAVERLYAGSFASIHSLVETMTAAGTGRNEAVEAAVAEAETAIPAREWKRASDALDRARVAAYESLDRLLDARRRDLDSIYDPNLDPAGPEAEARAQAQLGIQDARERREYPLAVQRITEEEARARLGRIATLERSVHLLKERVWVGEKLGLDTTPVMELFSEAKIALEAGKYASVEANVRQGNERLANLVEARLAERRRVGRDRAPLRAGRAERHARHPPRTARLRRGSRAIRRARRRGPDPPRRRGGAQPAEGAPPRAPEHPLPNRLGALEGLRTAHRHDRRPEAPRRVDPHPGRGLPEGARQGPGGAEAPPGPAEARRDDDRVLAVQATESVGARLGPSRGPDEVRLISRGRRPPSHCQPVGREVGPGAGRGEGGRYSTACFSPRRRSSCETCSVIWTISWHRAGFEK